MKRYLNRVPIILAALGLGISLTGVGAAYASGLIDGSSIKSHTISANKLTKDAVESLRGHGGEGHKGDTGPPGAPGAPGVNAPGWVTTHVTGGDSSICGGDWANDNYTRTLQFIPQDNGTINVVRYYKGTFTTIAGVPQPSPAACPGTLQTGGVKGTFSGFDVVVITGGNYNPDATCADPCTTTAMLAAFFPGGTSAVNHGWEYHYFTTANGDWVNADPLRGGNVGNITG